HQAGLALPLLGSAEEHRAPGGARRGLRLVEPIAALAAEAVVGGRCRAAFGAGAGRQSHGPIVEDGRRKSNGAGASWGVLSERAQIARRRLADGCRGVLRQSLERRTRARVACGAERAGGSLADEA